MCLACRLNSPRPFPAVLSDRLNMKTLLAPACEFINPAGSTSHTEVWQPDSLPAVSLVDVQLSSRGAVAWAARLGLGQGVCRGVFDGRVGAPHLRRGGSRELSGRPEDSQHQTLQPRTATSLSPSALGSWHCANMRRLHKLCLGVACAAHETTPSCISVTEKT